MHSLIHASTSTASPDAVLHNPHWVRDERPHQPELQLVLRDALQSLANWPLTLIEPAPLQVSAAEAVAVFCNAGPITDFDDVCRAREREQALADARILPRPLLAYCGQAPRMWGRYRASIDATLDPALIQAFAQSPPDDQAQLLSQLHPGTKLGYQRCMQLMSHLSPLAQGPLMVCLQAMDADGEALCQAMMDALNPSQRMLLAENALQAGMSVGDLRRALMLDGTMWQPYVWQLEAIAVQQLPLRRAIAAGLSFAELDTRYGPFLTSHAEMLDVLFCQHRAAEALRAGATCAELAQQWGASRFDTPRTISYLAFEDDPHALRDYEQSHGFQPDPLSEQQTRHWAMAVRAAGPVGSGIQPLGPLIQQQPELGQQALRKKLESALAYGAAGLDVFSGQRTVVQALDHYQLATDTARALLELSEELGRLSRIPGP